MKNLTIKLDAATVAQVIEEHINARMLKDGQGANVTSLTASIAPQSGPNVPALELFATFDVVMAGTTWPQAKE